MSVGWLDHGEEDQREAKEQLAQFNAENTLEELELQPFLKAILFDTELRPPTTSQELGGAEKDAGKVLTLLSDLAIKGVIRVYTEGAVRIDEINRLFNAFENTQLIDDEFSRFWETLVAVETEAREIVAND